MQTEETKITLAEMTQTIDSIKRIALSILGTEKQLEGDKKKIQETEWTVRLTVAEAVDDKGKAVYGNEMKRSAAVEGILNSDSAHQSLIRDVETSKRLIREAEIELEYLRNRVKFLNRFLAIIGGE